MSTIEDLDFSEFDVKTEYTFNETYKEFVKIKGKDVVRIDKSYCVRSVARDTLKQTPNEVADQYIRDNPKQVETNNISSKIDDPFKLLKLQAKTSVQTLVDRHIPYFPYYGSFAYSCSCGSGKTLAGLQIISALQCRTLIISSRNAVNDQWKYIISKLYPKLVIETKKKQYKGGNKLKPSNYLPEADIYIDTPQYLASKIDTLTITPSLIIFDEVHSLLSHNFIQVLLYPLVRTMKGAQKELPYMVALSATYPPMCSREYKSLMKIFGKAYRTESAITDIPVYIWDYYDHYRSVEKDSYGRLKEVFGDVARGNWDAKYKALEDWEAVEFFCDAIDGCNKQINNDIARLAKSAITNTNKPNTQRRTSISDEQRLSIMNKISEIDPTDINHKGIIMTYTIDSSAYAAIYCHLRWNVPVLLIRSVDEPDLYIGNGGPADVFELENTTTYDDLVAAKVGVQCNYQAYLDSVPIIVGTFHRLKEGFSVQNITWGICTKFVWSYISRVQLVGRIRRSSEDPELNSHTRILLCSAAIRPSNLRVPKARKPYHWKYDLKTEEGLFEFENYVKI